MRLLEASVFKKAPPELREILMKSGVLPVNDIYLPIWQSTKLINLLYGSYGSGKSVAIVDRLIDKALQNKYFRCYFGRKILNDVRGSVFKTIIDRIRERNLKHKFLFSEAPTGSMTIICKDNGNEFIPFGANDTESLKSIKDPTDFFCEELNQFTFEDFRFILSRLRKEEVLLQFWGAFNTDKVYQSHWIRMNLFSDNNEFETLIYRLKANYTENYFINQETYLMTLRLAAGGNIGIFNAIAKGEWGMIRTGDEFWKQFDESRHVKAVKIEETTLHVSVDNNVNPYVTQTVWQVLPAEKQIRQVGEMLCRAPENNAPKAARAFAKWLHSIEYKDVLFVYGDPSASNKSTIDENNESFFDKYIAELQAAGIKVVSRVQKSAPRVALSAAFINDIYETNYAGWTILISDNCFESIEDYILVKEDFDGKMKKPKVTNKETQVRFEPQGHISDTKRYFITSVLAAIFKTYKQRTNKMKWYSVPG
jgi:hypothetical protein